MDDEEPARRRAFWRELPILLGVAILVAVLVRTFLLQTYYIPSESMEHTLEVRDRVLVNKLVYHFRDPERGEIIVFEAPPEWRSRPTEDAFIKRVVGVGGDAVGCCDPDGRLIINGAPLDEPYIYTDANGTTDPAAPTEFEVVVPEGRLWVLGDHRQHSGDSMERYESTDGDAAAATIDVDDVIGRAFLRFWPLGRVGWLSVPSGYDEVPASAQEIPASRHGGSLEPARKPARRRMQEG